jgi:hypothetical protein
LPSPRRRSQQGAEAAEVEAEAVGAVRAVAAARALAVAAVRAVVQEREQVQAPGEQLTA